MNIIKKLDHLKIFLFFFFLLFNVVFSQNKKNNEVKIKIIQKDKFIFQIINYNKNYKYEIYFAHTNKEKINLFQVITFHSDIYTSSKSLIENRNFNYFKLRAINDKNLPGYWSKYFKVNDYIKKKPKNLPKIKLALIEIATKEIKKQYLNAQLIKFTDLNSEYKIYYKINNTEYILYMKPIKLNNSGKYTFEYKIVDKNNKILKKFKSKFTIDALPSVSKIKIFNPVFREKNKTWVNKKSIIKIQGYDADSGLKKLMYSIHKKNEKPNYLEYKKPIQIKLYLMKYCSDCVFSYKSLDNVNNQEKPSFIDIAIDNEAPVIEKIKNKKYTWQIKNEIFPVDVQIYQNKKLLYRKSFYKKIVIKDLLMTHFIVTDILDNKIKIDLSK